MVIASEFYFPSSDGRTLIHVNQWTPLGGPVAGVVQIAHGVAEYGARYEPFARFLCGHGFAVVANDHLGHGKSLVEGCPMVYFGDENGWRHAVEDMEELRRRTAKVFPGVPYFLFGHSMGSFLSRTHLIRYPGRLDGCVLCGTGHMSPALIAGGKLIADREIRRLGRKAYSAKADQLAFGAYNKPFAPNRTRFDWISASEANVDAYIADPLCGGDTTLGLFRDMLGGLGIITKQANIERMGTRTRWARWARACGGLTRPSGRPAWGTCPSSSTMACAMRSSTRPAAGTSIRTCWTGWRPGPKGRTKPAAPCRDTMSKPGR